MRAGILLIGEVAHHRAIEAKLRELRALVK